MSGIFNWAYPIIQTIQISKPHSSNSRLKQVRKLVDFYVQFQSLLVKMVSLWKENFGNEYYKNPEFLVFSWTIKTKSDFMASHSSWANQSPALQEAARRLALYLLHSLLLPMLSKRELNTEFTSGVTTVLCDTSPWFCLVIRRVRQEEKREWKTGNETKQVIWRQFSSRATTLPTGDSTA